ncbi:MAG TPA: YhcH/YjgK/YiaL family protein [Ruminiclostridium sp.]
MILDTLDNISLYTALNSRFEKAFRFLKDTALESLNVGKYQIDGEDIFALVQSYTTSASEEKRWEAHKKYIDIQYVVTGNEINEWIPTDMLKVLEEYSDEKDIAFFKEPDQWTSAKLKDGYFTIFFPEDAHKPGCLIETPSQVKKVVVKVKI